MISLEQTKFCDLQKIMNMKLSFLNSIKQACFGNLLDGSNQGRFIVFLVDNVGNSNPLLWASKRIKRAVESTLAAEILSLVEAAENTCLLAQFIAEILPLVENSISHVLQIVKVYMMYLIPQTLVKND